MLKALNNKYVKIFIIFCIFFYFFKTIELNTLSKDFLLFSKSYFFLSILLFIPNTFLSIYKWFLLTKKFNNNNIFSLYKQFSFIFFLSDIIHNPTLVEVSKFISLKKISNFEKTAIIFNDKIIIILTKAIYTFFFLLLLNQSNFI
jgi:hypothetical protein